MDESGFRHLCLDVRFPDFPSAANGLDKLFQNPDISAAIVEAAVEGGELVFELEVFGLSSKVNELLMSSLALGENVAVRIGLLQPSYPTETEEIDPEAGVSRTPDECAFLLEVH